MNGLRWRFAGIAAAIILLAILPLSDIDGAEKVYPPYTKRANIAHRGASWDAPEHTLEAYRLALKQGADFLEPDLQFSRDGILVCLHDTTLERTTDVAARYPERARLMKGKKTWPVSEFTLAEIQSLDAGSWKSAKFAGAKIPTFQEVIDLARGRAGLFPETKSPERFAAGQQTMEAALMEILKRNRLDQPGAEPKTPVVIQSFSEASLKRLRSELGCRLPLIFLTGSGDLSRQRLEEIRQFAVGIGPNKAAIRQRPELVTDAHVLGLSVTAWTFRTGSTAPFPTVEAEMKHYLDTWKVDAVFTDEPGKFPRE